jgi:hypothetical protein
MPTMRRRHLAFAAAFILTALAVSCRSLDRERAARLDEIETDLRLLAEEEAKSIDAYLRGKRYDIVIDHHENRFADGYSLIAHDESVRPELAAFIEALPRYAVAKKLPKVDDYAEGITIIRPGAGKAFSQYAFARLVGSKRSFVIETPTAWPLEKRVRCHLDLEARLEAAVSR